MILRCSRILFCGGALVMLGCHHTLEGPARFADRSSFEARFSMASDDPSGLETGRGHSPSLASELADRRHQADAKRSRVAVERLLERGHDADAHGRAQEAKGYYEQVLAQQPDHPEAHHRLAILADRAGDFESAEMHYQQALRADPGDANVLNDLGYSCFLQGRAADSERHLNQALRINPRHPHVQENLSLLYDPQKAEKVLLTIMGPHQTQATLEKLFEDFPNGVPQPPTAQTATNRPSINVTEITPRVPEDFQQKTAEARLQNIAEQQRANAFKQQAGLPPLPGPYPQAVPPRTGFGSSGELAEGRIPDGFRSVDNAGIASNDPAQPGMMANQFAQDTWQNDRAGNVNSVTTQDPRPAGPQWTTPPVAWPDYAPERSSAGTIQQASYSEPAADSQNTKSRQLLPSATQRAAEIGMATGPGALFPPLEDSFESATPQQSAVSATQFHSGTNAGTNFQPGGQQPPESFAPQFGSAPQAQPGTLETGQPQPWPISHTQPYEARQHDLPIIVPRPNPNNGQSLPQYHSATQYAPQNDGGHW